MYRAPVDEIAFTLKHVTGLGEAMNAGAAGDLSEDIVDAILTEAGRFATDEIYPARKAGDEIGAVWKDKAVTTPPGWRDIYRAWIDGGWNSLNGPGEYGGQALPMTLGVAALEMWNSGSMGFAIGPTLTMGAVEALEKHGSEHLRETYLAKLVSGEWMGTMNLTEPQAGSDLAALRARAVPEGDGTYRIFGQKIFITYGEHDFTDNIVHLVLARLPDAPEGTRGISLFLVPKFHVNTDGSLGERNDAFAASIEHKLGIHGSPTCTMIYGDGFAPQGGKPGAIGWLIGEENKGLACMFTMMNNARLAVGMQGVAIAEAAFQKALAYANDRRQGKAASYSGEGMAPIVHHPDVQRNLLTMQALTRMARAISYNCAHALDMAKSGADAAHWRDRANLLTPVAKAFSTDVGVDVASLGVQVHGGMGFIEETGAAQLLRDARIAPIYEGTNGIQAIDLVMRKLPLDNGGHIAGYIAELREVVAQVAASNRAFGETAERLGQALDDFEATTAWLQQAVSEGRTQDALAGATPYQRLFGLAAGSVYLAKAALADGSDIRLPLCRFAAENLVDECAALRRRVLTGSASLMAAGSQLLT